MTRFKITQEILDYISEHSANFSEVTPSPTLREEWIVKGIKTYPNVNNGNSVVEAERKDGCYIRLPENIVKIYTIDKEQTGFEMALAEMIDKAQKCVVEPLVVAEQWKDELIKLAKSEEPVSESIDFEQELYKAFGQIKDFTLGVAIAKRFYDMGRKHNKPVSEELEDAASSFARKDSEGISNPTNFYYTIADKARIFKAGAEWQKARLMANATEVTVHLDAGGYPYIPQMELYDYDKDIPLAKEGDKYKVILIKEE